MHSKGIVGAVSMKELNGQNIGLFIVLQQAEKRYKEILNQLAKDKSELQTIETTSGDEGDKSKGEECMITQVGVSNNTCIQLERVESFIEFASSAEYAGCCRNKACEDDVQLARILESGFSPLCLKCAQQKQRRG